MASHRLRLLGLTMAAAVVAPTLMSASVTAQAQLPGAAAMRLLEARYDHTATLVDDDYIVVAGGSDGARELASVEEVDPLGTSVATLGSLAVARAGHSASRLPDGRILVAGGQAGGATLADAELFDPLSGETKQITSMHHARAYHEVITLPDGRLLLVGGVDGEGAAAGAETFDPTTELFLEVAAPDVPVAAATGLADGRVLVTRANEPAVAGGADEGKAGTGGTEAKAKKKAKDKKAKDKKAKDKKAGSSTPKAQQVYVQLYDPAADEWLPVKGGDTLADNDALALPDGRVLLARGADAATVLFEPATGEMGSSGVMSSPRQDATATLLPDGRALLVGGTHEGRGVAALEVFEPAAGEFQHVGDLLIPRTSHTATALPDGRVLIMGGRFADLALDDIVVFDPLDATLQALSLDMDVATEPVSGPDPRTSADIRAEYGPPEAFAAYYFDDVAADGTIVPTSIETWSYPSRGVGFTFEAGRVVAEDVVELEADAGYVVAPYDPDRFRAYMSTEEVVAAAGIDEYIGGPADEAIEGGELFFAPQLTWGVQDGELRYIEAFAIDGALADEE